MLSQLTLAWFLLQLPHSETNWPKKQLILGHRGARAQAPENTLVSFKGAMQMGADGIELDVFLSRDKVPVVIHDDTLDRTTNGTGLVWEKDIAELQSYNAAKGWPHEGVTIPTLLETLQALPDGATINVELKGAGLYTKEELADRVLDTIKDHRQRLSVIISSFDFKLLKIVRTKDSEIIIGLLLDENDPSFKEALSFAAAIKPDSLNITPKLGAWWLVKLAQAKGLHVMLWTINDQQAAKGRLSAGIDGIFSDLPEGFLWTDSKR